MKYVSCKLHTSYVSWCRINYYLPYQCLRWQQPQQPPRWLPSVSVSGKVANILISVAMTHFVCLS